MWLTEIQEQLVIDSNPCGCRLHSVRIWSIQKNLHNGSLYTDVYVTPSNLEEDRITVVEAIAAGTPCVVREAKAFADWCSADGVVCFEDAAAVADAMRGIRSRVPDSAISLQTWDGTIDENIDIRTV